jgi:hypothetical protein
VREVEVDLEFSFLPVFGVEDAAPSWKHVLKMAREAMSRGTRLP